MEWASEKQEISPSFNQLAVDKSTIADVEYFEDLVGLYNLQIIRNEENYFILDGNPDDLSEFSRDWNWE